jgi:hypothetical protein
MGVASQGVAWPDELGSDTGRVRWRTVPCRHASDGLRESFASTVILRGHGQHLHQRQSAMTCVWHGVDHSVIARHRLQTPLPELNEAGFVGGGPGLPPSHPLLVSIERIASGVPEDDDLLQEFALVRRGARRLIPGRVRMQQTASRTTGAGPCDGLQPVRAETSEPASLRSPSVPSTSIDMDRLGLEWGRCPGADLGKP